MAGVFGSAPSSPRSKARWLLGGVLLTFLMLGAVWVAGGNEEAAGQDRQAANQATTASPPAASPSAASPPAASPAPAFDGLESLFDEGLREHRGRGGDGGIPGWAPSR
jgi:hypothetical protein